MCHSRWNRHKPYCPYWLCLSLNKAEATLVKSERDITPRSSPMLVYDEAWLPKWREYHSTLLYSLKRTVPSVRGHITRTNTSTVKGLYSTAEDLFFHEDKDEWNKGTLSQLTPWTLSCSFGLLEHKSNDINIGLSPSRQGLWGPKWRQCPCLYKHEVISGDQARTS
jgi:hypothetical protein